MRRDHTKRSNDLLADWGLSGQYEHPRLREAYAKTIAVCRGRGKHVGVGGLSSRPRLAAEFVRMGAHAMFRQGPILVSCLAPARPRPKKCTT